MKLTKETQDFNNWVLGGAYSRTSLKRTKIREDIELTKKSQAEALPSDDPYMRKLEKRKAELKDQRSKPNTQYKSRVPLGYKPQSSHGEVDAPNLGQASGRDNLSAAEGIEEDKPKSPSPFKSRNMRKASPPRQSSPPRAQTPPRSAEQLSEAAVLRERLRESFQKTAASQVSNSLFPPLLTPYNRPSSYAQKFEGIPSKSQVPEPDLNAMKPPNRFSGTMPDREEFSLARSDKVRPQPRSGPQAFVPTAAPGAVWRMLARSQYSAQMAPAPTSTSVRFKPTSSHKARTTVSGEEANQLADVLSSDKKHLSSPKNNNNSNSPQSTNNSPAKKQQQESNAEAEHSSAPAKEEPKTE